MCISSHRLYLLVFLSSASAADGPSSLTFVFLCLWSQPASPGRRGAENMPREWATPHPKKKTLHKQGWLLSWRQDARCDTPFVATVTCKEPPASFRTICLAGSSRATPAGCPLGGQGGKRSVQSPTSVQDNRRCYARAPKTQSLGRSARVRYHFADLFLDTLSEEFFFPLPSLFGSDPTVTVTAYFLDHMSSASVRTIKSHCRFRIFFPRSAYHC